MALAACTFHGVNKIYLGDPLSEVWKTVVQCRETSLAYSQLKVVILSSCALQLCQNLQGKSKDPLLLSGDYFNDATLKQLETRSLNTVVRVIAHLKFMLAACLNGNVYADFLFRENKASFLDSMFPLQAIYHSFFRGLVSAALARDSVGRPRRRFIADAKRKIEKLKKFLSYCPENVINKVYLIEAELEFGKGRYSTALLHYKKSISYAKKAEFIAEHGLACEKTGIMLQKAKSRR